MGELMPSRSPALHPLQRNSASPSQIYWVPTSDTGSSPQNQRRGPLAVLSECPCPLNTNPFLLKYMHVHLIACLASPHSEEQLF